jgi:hypothetical protein
MTADFQPGHIHGRSQASLEFETFWRSLSAKGSVPRKSDFRPDAIASHLKNIVLVEIHFGSVPNLRIRVAGDAIRERAHANIAGSNFLDYLPPAYHASAMESSRLMLTHPCGLWQTSAAHYKRGFAQYMEMTMFPLAPGEGEPPFILVLMQPVGGMIEPASSGHLPFVYDSAAAFEFLDVGAGVPVWPPAVAAS